MDGIKQFLDVIFYLVVTIGIFILAYYSTKLIASKSHGLNRNKNLKIVEKIYLGKGKEAALVKVGDDYYIAGISQGSVSFTGPLSQEAKSKIVLEQEYDAVANPGFYGPFKSYKYQALIVKISEFLKKIMKTSKGKSDDFK